MPLITLITDFGTQDGYVGAMKGRLLSLAPTATLLDLTHDIPPQNLIHAAFCLTQCIPEFPSSTIHVVIVDPGIGSARKGLAVETKQGWLIAPDNGVLSLVLEKIPPLKMIQIAQPTNYRPSHDSLEGLAVFYHAAAYLANGHDVRAMGVEIQTYQKLSLPEPELKGNHLEGEILVFDRFGNAITNIPGSLLESRHRIVQCRNQTVSLVQYYQQGEEQENRAIAIINSDGLLELAVFCGSARERMQLKIGDKVRVIFENDVAAFER